MFRMIRRNGLLESMRTRNLQGNRCTGYPPRVWMGKPHAAPSGESGRNNNFYFETDPDSPKGRNLVNNARIVFHVQDGTEVQVQA